MSKLIVPNKKYCGFLHVNYASIKKPHKHRLIRETTQFFFPWKSKI